MEDFFPSQNIPSRNLRRQQGEMTGFGDFFCTIFGFVIFRPGFNHYFVRTNLLSEFPLYSGVTNL